MNLRIQVKGQFTIRAESMDHVTVMTQTLDPILQRVCPGESLNVRFAPMENLAASDQWDAFEREIVDQMQNPSRLNIDPQESLKSGILRFEPLAAGIQRFAGHVTGDFEIEADSFEDGERKLSTLLSVISRLFSFAEMVSEITLNGSGRGRILLKAPQASVQLRTSRAVGLP